MATRTTTGAATKRAPAASPAKRTSAKPATPAIPVKRTRNAEATKERILAVCMEVFSQSGFRGMRIAEIAKQVGITEAGVLHHYPSKQALLEALLAYRERDTEVVQERFLNVRGLGGIRALEHVADLISSKPTRAQLYLVLQAESLGPERQAREFMLARDGRTVRTIALHIREAQEDGEARLDLDPEALALEVTAFMKGMDLIWLLHDRDFDLVAAWQAYLDGFIARIAVPKTKRR